MVAVLSEIKPWAEAVLARGGPARLARALRAPADHLVGYHNIVPDAAAVAGDRSLHLPLSRFREHLDRIGEMARVVPLRELLDEPEPAEPEARVALTFDDAYRGALTLGLDELEARGWPATVFVPPGCLGDRTFWWDALSDERGRPLRGVARDVALAVFRGERDRVLGWGERCGLRRVRAHPVARSVRADELDEVADRPGVTLGSHGWSHTNLAAEDPRRLEAQLGLSLGWLRKRYDERALPVISYPYGRRSPEVERAAERVGYRAGVRVRGGALSRIGPRPFSVPRINAPAGLSAHGLHLRLAGLRS